jgi:F-type H+-transporting ATPase subunit delta
MVRRSWQGGVTKRYAKALFEVALKHGDIEGVEGELSFVQAVIEHHPTLLKILSHPLIPFHKKSEMLQKRFSNHVSELVMRFLELLQKRGRVGELKNILMHFKEMADDWRGILHVEVKSAVELTESELERIKEWASQLWGKKVIIKAGVDESIIGGLVIKAGDKLLDLSIKGAIESILAKVRGAYIQLTASEHAEGEHSASP